jgi:uncharacterized membrane protein
MILMAVDHVRDYFLQTTIPPSLGLFLTRWITHFCAPTFFFLAGTSSYLSFIQPRALIVRGVELIILEFTVVFFAWHFNFNFGILHLSVMWAIGWSLIFLACLLPLPRYAIGFIALIIIAGHNACDRILPGSLGVFAGLWSMLHGPFAHIGNAPILVVVYPILPWVGVTAAGYVFGPIFHMQNTLGRRMLLSIGCSMILLFLLFRMTNLYGNPTLWNGTAQSFIDCAKYPPSLLFLLMTIGPMFILLGMLNKNVPNFFRYAILLGRMPLLYYIVHLYVIHGAAVLLAWIQTGEMHWMFQSFVDLRPPPNYGFGLIGVYIVWTAVVIFCYLICRQFDAHLKRFVKSRI